MVEILFAVAIKATLQETCVYGRGTDCGNKGWSGAEVGSTVLAAFFSADSTYLVLPKGFYF